MNAGDSDDISSLPPLASLGDRICILGPSNSGKSTLADAFAQKLACEVFHLDLFRHLPDTDWVERPDGDFRQLHDEAILASRWVMDGNYSSLLPQRLARATGLIVLDVSTGTSLVRYLRRSWFEPARIGGLQGGQDSVKWGMLRYITVDTRPNRRRYAQMFAESDLAKVRLGSVRAIARAYRTWELDAPR